MKKQYWVGDLCYVLAQWEEFCSITYPSDDKKVTGNIQLSDGTKLSFQGTARGDGTYHDQYGLEYPVDAGLIGVISVDDITIPLQADNNGGHIHMFESLPTAIYNNGELIIGHIHIETNDMYEPEQDDYDVYDEGDDD
jgi:hypothetical protein